MRPLYIFDLDGTLALIDHRRHLVERPSLRCQACSGWRPDCDCGDLDVGFKADWPAFFAACVDDLPNRPVIRTMQRLLHARADVQVWSGRSAVVMNETIGWLQRHVFCDDTKLDPDKVQLVMRREGDFTPDDELKAGWLDALHPMDRQRLVAVFDDRQKVVDMWRSKGVACFQVAPGEF